MQRVAVCCRQQCVAVSSVLQCVQRGLYPASQVTLHKTFRTPVAVRCSVLQSAVCFSQQCVAVCCNVFKGEYNLRVRQHGVKRFGRLLQRVAVCCSVLQCVAVCCSVFKGDYILRVRLHCVKHFERLLQCVAVCCSVLQCVAVCCSVLQCVLVSGTTRRKTFRMPVAMCCSVLQCVAVCCSVL